MSQEVEMGRYQLESFVRVHKLTPARRALVLERMKRKLDALVAPEFARVRVLAGEALKLQREVLGLTQARRSHQEDTMHADGARALDAKLDKLLSLLYGTLQGLVEVFEGDQSRLARKVRDAVFPDGVAPITKRPFVEQHELIKWMIRELGHGELGAAMTALGLETWVTRLDELNAAYGQHLTRGSDRVDPDRIRAAEARAWLALVEVVTAVLVLYPTPSEADAAGRKQLLQPLVEQQEEAALLRSRRRGGTAEDGLPVEDTLAPEEHGDDETEVEEAAALAG
jgi:hypothetical protein